MGDIDKKLDKYDCWLKEIWNGLDKAIAFAKDRPSEKNIWVACKLFSHYQEIVEFMVEHSAKFRGDFDLAFLSEETVWDLSEHQLREWQDKIPVLRGRLENVREGKE
ncbi:MAG: hypothetical protein V3U04_09760 [Candidatus Aerophobetes bacterium]